MKWRIRELKCSFNCLFSKCYINRCFKDNWNLFGQKKESYTKKWRKKKDQRSKRGFVKNRDGRVQGSFQSLGILAFFYKKVAFFFNMKILEWDFWENEATYGFVILKKKDRIKRYVLAFCIKRCKNRERKWKNMHSIDLCNADEL